MLRYNKNIHREGFSLIEIMVGSAIFLIVAIAAYQAYTSLLQVAQLNKAKLLAIDLADEQFEIIRNMPYANVGLTTGIPQGTLPQTRIVTRGNLAFTVNLTIRNVNLSSSTYQVSSRVVEVEITCDSCKDFRPVSLTGQVAPANLQTASNGGALVAQVIDANGAPVQGATVSMHSTASSTIMNTDTTNNAGLLNIIGVPPAVDAYNVSATKAGYSTDQTYAKTTENPNPIRPDVTVVDLQVSGVTLSIDRLSSLHIHSVSPSCQSVQSINFHMSGAKEIGAGIPAYDHDFVTNGAGRVDANNLTWDSYTITPTDTDFVLAGITPPSPIPLQPNNSQNVQMVVIPKQSNTILVTVVDSGTKFPISDATVKLSSGGVDHILVTGKGYMEQKDWSAGTGFEYFTDPGGYSADDGNIDNTTPGNVTLRQSFGNYNPSGILESSIFDTGSSSNFYTLSWKPVNQLPLTGDGSLRFQLASNATVTPTTTWRYFGPDATNATYYTVTDSSISAVHNFDQFLRYKAYLSTETATVTPILSDVNFTYASSCTPPGQVLFSALPAGTYSIDVSASGYTTLSDTIEVTSDWQNKEMQLSH
jgi:prepilin-type N-terminal cleavage/methylation domain-containing protein